jgi:hypothetical protein
MSDSLTFQSIHQEQQWSNPKHSALLKSIVLLAAAYAFSAWGWIFRLTSIYRTPEEDRELGGTGIHPAWRADDVGAAGVPQEHVDAVTDWINARWEYDPDRPNLPVAYSKPHGTGAHIHVQVHAHTRKRDLVRGA